MDFEDFLDNSTWSNSSFGNSTYEYTIVNEPPLGELIPVSIVYGLTLVLGLVGNMLVIFSVTRYEQMMTTTNTFLLSLASADLLLVTVCVPVKFVAFFSYMWRFGEFLCKSVHYIQNVSCICSIATLTLMSLERYYAIVHPMKAKYSCTVGKARRMCIFLWLLSFLLAIPILFGRLRVHRNRRHFRLVWRLILLHMVPIIDFLLVTILQPMESTGCSHVHITVGLYRKATWCLKEWSSPVYTVTYELYMFCVILLFPVLIMSFAYLRICQELWFMTRNRSVMRNEPTFKCRPGQVTNSRPHPPTVHKVKFVDDHNTKKQVIKMLVAIIFVFVICWAPITINNVLVAFKVLPMLHVGPVKYVREAFHIMSYANSCVNPVVYGFMSKNFRQTFRNSLCRCVRGKDYIRRQMFRSQTETSYMADDNLATRGMLSKESTIDDDLILDDAETPFTTSNHGNV